MPTRPHRTYADLRDELEQTKWLLRQARLQLDALADPDRLDLKDALAYARGLGASSPDRVPLRILAAGVEAARRDKRLTLRMLREKLLAVVGEREDVLKVFEEVGG
jgi:hypothetical protein